MAGVTNTPTKALREASTRAREELQQRLADERRTQNIFLNPEDVRGEYDAGRGLLTTLGGTARPITQDDLKQFAHLAKKMGAKFTGGIRAKQAIDLSLPDRIDRSNEQIHYAIPLRYGKGSITFTTNTTRASKVVRHYVKVDFVNFNAAIAAPTKLSTLARALAGGLLRFDCDCEDTRYRFRYIATIGKFNAGRPETGMPKLTNPTLKGCCCVHTLRVLRSLTSAPTLKVIERMLVDAREGLDPKPRKLTVAEVEDIAKHQQRQKSRATSKIETTAARSERLAATRAMKAASTRSTPTRAPRAPTAEADTRQQSILAKFTRQMKLMMGKGIPAEALEAAMREAMKASK